MVAQQASNLRLPRVKAKHQRNPLPIVLLKEFPQNKIYFYSAASDFE